MDTWIFNASLQQRGERTWRTIGSLVVKNLFGKQECIKLAELTVDDSVCWTCDDTKKIQAGLT